MITKKPEIFLILILFIFSFFLFSNTSHAVYSGDYTYSDPNNTVFSSYNVILNDFILRLSNSTNNETISNQIKDLINDGSYGVYVFYGVSSGASMINATTYNQGTLRVFFYELGENAVTSSPYDNYQGISTNVRLMETSGSHFYFEGNDVYYDNDVPSQIYIPANLYNYRSDNLVNSLSTSASISSSVAELTESFNKQDLDEADDTVNSDFYDLYEATGDYNSDSNSIFNFNKGFWTIITNSLTDDNVVKTVTINLPFVTGGITFRSDMLYNIIKNTLIYTLLQLCYAYVFGMYIVMGMWRLLCWFQQGEFTKTKNIPINNVMNHMLM